MRQLFPDPRDEVDPYEAYRPPAGPLVRVNMVLSADGTVQDRDGKAGGLSGAADQNLFRVLRAQADAILVGAGTVRVEGYGPHRLRRDLADRRAADGRSAPATVVVVSNSLELPTGAPLFTEARVPTIVATSLAAPAERRRAIEAAGGRVLTAGDAAVDMAHLLSVLRVEHGLQHILCEGGPTLNASLFAPGLVDELCLTLSPRLVGAAGLQVVGGLPVPAELRVEHVLEEDGELFLRYAVRTT